MCALANRHHDAIAVSALTQAGIDDLVRRIAVVASAHDRLVSVLVPYDRGDLVSIAHERALIVREEHGESGTRIDMQIGPAYAPLFDTFLIEEDKSKAS